MSNPVTVAPNWAAYVVIWPVGESFCADIESAALVTRAQREDRFCVVRTGDGAQVWPPFNPALPRGAS